MSLLAEPKRKVKYSLNPRGHLWANGKSGHVFFHLQQITFDSVSGQLISYLVNKLVIKLVIKLFQMKASLVNVC